VRCNLMKECLPIQRVPCHLCARGLSPGSAPLAAEQMGLSRSEAGVCVGGAAEGLRKTEALNGHSSAR